jgi:hypothetical protein
MGRKSQEKKLRQLIDVAVPKARVASWVTGVVFSILGAVQVGTRAIDAIDTGLTLVEIWAAIPFIGRALAHWSSGLVLIALGWAVLAFRDLKQAHPIGAPKLLDAHGRHVSIRVSAPVREARTLFVRSCATGMAVTLAWFLIARFGYPPPTGYVELEGISVYSDYAEIAPGKRLIFSTHVTNSAAGPAYRPYFLLQCVIPEEPTSQNKARLEAILSNAWSIIHRESRTERINHARNTGTLEKGMHTRANAPCPPLTAAQAKWILSGETRLVLMVINEWGPLGRMSTSEYALALKTPSSPRLSMNGLDSSLRDWEIINIIH